MKRFLQIIAAVSFLAAIVCFTGCATSGGAAAKPAPQAVAYFTLRDTWDAVDGAMRVYGVAVVNGRVSAATEKKIDAAHEKFRVAFKSAVRLAKRDYSTFTPPDVQALANEVLYLLQEFN